MTIIHKYTMYISHKLLTTFNDNLTIYRNISINEISIEFHMILKFICS